MIGLAPSERSNTPVGTWDEAYRRYQRALTTRYLIPVLARWSVVLPGKSLLEVGCGDGGCAAEFYRAGCRVTAIDINERLVGIAADLNRKENVDVRTIAGDVCRGDSPGLDEGPFDIIVLRDVVEHLECLDTALGNVKAAMAPGGVVFVVFPPYYSPYGAHQQILPAKKLGFLPYNKLPYIQLLPDRFFNAVTAGEAAPNQDVHALRRIRLTLGRFENHARRTGFVVKRRKYYLLRPTYKLRYGVPVVGAGILGRVPVLRELIVTAGYYLLEQKV